MNASRSMESSLTRTAPAASDCGSSVVLTIVLACVAGRSMLPAVLRASHSSSERVRMNPTPSPLREPFEISCVKDEGS